MITLYDCFCSSASYRVRIALNLKGLRYESIPINIREGTQKTSFYLQINPQGLVPTLIDEVSNVITQSLAILEYLEETYPEPALLTGTSYERARIRACMTQIACDIHPLNNLRTLHYLKDLFDINEHKRNVWYRHWVNEGFRALEASVEGPHYCFQNKITLADVCLIPQIYNALRYEVDLRAYPKLWSIYQACSSLLPFKQAMPKE